MTNVAITGHRPNKLNLTYEDYVNEIREVLLDLQASYVYEGQAAGADLLAARAAFMNETPYTAAVPWKGHRESLPIDWRKDWDEGIRHADYVEFLSDSQTFPGNWVYFNRNKYMVDHADIVLAIWDGSTGRGGTWHATSYARGLGRPIWVLNPETLELRRDEWQD